MLLARSTCRGFDTSQTLGPSREMATSTVNAGEFDDPEYLANPVNRCFHCKKNLYRTLRDIREQLDSSSVLLSGTNLDDLDEFRPV